MTDLGLPHVNSGKVRDIYAVGDDRLLMVTSDRISAFDVVMAEPIPDKGRVLTAMSAFWFDLLGDVVPGHLISTDVDDLPESARAASAGADLAGRVMLTKRAEMLPVECIVRGYLSGSAWKEYARSGTMHGTRLPDGMQESDQLPEPVFTPSTKADEGHDENISFERRRRPHRRIAGRQGARRLGRALSPRRRVGAGAGHRHRRHQVRDGPGRRRAGAVRRGADPRLVAVLARRRRDARRHPAVVRQAAGARLPRRRSTGTRRPRRRRCPRRWWWPPAPATSRPTSASPAGRSPTGRASIDGTLPGGRRPGRSPAQRLRCPHALFGLRGDAAARRHRRPRGGDDRAFAPRAGLLRGVGRQGRQVLPVPGRGGRRRRRPVRGGGHLRPLPDQPGPRVGGHLGEEAA